jgi:putative ABC transport system substrate-binding protein
MLLMNRRAFIVGLVLGTLGASRVARPQPARKVYRIGMLSAFTATSEMVGPHPQSPFVSAFLHGMRDLGYVYGENFVTEPRGGEGQSERYPTLAGELVRLKVDVIVAAGPSLLALKQATSTIPIVMAASGDPVRSKVVQSLAHPGGNFTGFSLNMAETTAKRLQLLKELVPGAGLVAVLWDRAGPALWEATEAAAKLRGWKLLSVAVSEATEIEGAFEAATRAHASAMLVFGSGTLDFHAGRIAELAARSRLPAMYDLRPYIEAGGLISYSVNLIEVWRRAAVYVDKIIKGAKPSDLPVEQPTKFELVINLKAAKALGLSIPQPVLLQADEVIQWP